MLQHLPVFIQKSKGLGIDIASHIHSNLMNFRIRKGEEKAF